MKWILLAFFLTSNFAFSKEKDPVVATVNGVTIKKSTLLSYHKQNLNLPQSKRKITLESSLNDLIDRIIGLKKAKELNFDKRPEVRKKMNDVVYHAYLSDVLTPMLKGIKVTDDDVKKYYKENPEYRTSQILIRLRTLPSEKDLGEAHALATKLRADIEIKPKSFEEIAKKYSQISTAELGGDMGYQPKVRLSPNYYNTIKGKKIGYISQPIRTQYGIHIIKVTGVKTFEQIDKKMYKKIVFDEKRDELLADYFEKQRNKAKIKIEKKVLDNV